LRFIEGAKKAKGVAVIIDVFRAFSFECYAIQNNAERIIPVASKDLAYELKRKNPEYILAGERKGIMLPGFDFGNSPSQIEHIDLSDKVIVHTTSAGTQGLENARNASEILTGSLVNAKAVANYIKLNNFDEVSLVCMGTDGVRPADEDDLCAEYIKSLLENNIYDITGQITDLKYKGGKKFFDAAQNDVFPERDFYLCTELNKFDFVLKFEYDSGGLGNIRKL
jgi:2-phosphosulfolactate phosphatase